LDVIRNADWVIDLGPEGGEDGGRVVGEGRPARIAATPGSYTGHFLTRYYTSSDGRLMEADLDEEQLPASDLGMAESIPAKNGKTGRAGSADKATRRQKKTGRP
jgi:excinuclease ABC subunit A